MSKEWDNKPGKSIAFEKLMDRRKRLKKQLRELDGVILRFLTVG